MSLEKYEPYLYESKFKARRIRSAYRANMHVIAPAQAAKRHLRKKVALLNKPCNLNNQSSIYMILK